MEYTRTPESLPENLRFISVESIEEMRNEQRALQADAAAEATRDLPLFPASEWRDAKAAAEHDVATRINEAAELYVADHLNRDDNEELFNGCVELVKRYSVLNMTESEWLAGEKNPDGSYVAGTAGQYKLWGELADLGSAPTPEDLTEDDPDEDDDPDEEEWLPMHSAAEVAQLEANLEGARTALAEISVQRRRLLTRNKGRKAKRLAEQYEAAQAVYDATKLELGKLSVEALQANGMSEDEIKGRVVAGVTSEHAAFTAAEVKYMESDGSKLGRFIRWYAGKKRNRIAANVTVGGASGFAINKLAKTGLLTILPGAGIAALAGIAGARAGKALLTAKWGNGAQLHNEFEKRREADEKKLTNQVTESVQAVTGGTADEYAQLFTGSTSGIVGERINADVRGNKKRTAVQAGIAGGAALAGALLADHIHMPFTDGKSSETGVRDSASEADRALREAGVTDADVRQNIIDHPDAFSRLVEAAQDQEAGGGGVHLDVDPSQVATDSHEALSGGNVFTIHEGGGIIKDVIRPAAYMEGHGLSHTQETQIWQAMRGKFGDNLFTNLPVGAHGSDQWVLNPGQGQLRPEVADFLKDQIAATQTSSQVAA